MWNPDFNIGALQKDRINNCWIDSTLWYMYSILMYIVLTEKKKGGEKENKYSVYNFSEHVEHEIFWKVNEEKLTNY